MSHNLEVRERGRKHILLVTYNGRRINTIKDVDEMMKSREIKEESNRSKRQSNCYMNPFGRRLLIHKRKCKHQLNMIRKRKECLHIKIRKSLQLVITDIIRIFI